MITKTFSPYKELGLKEDVRLLIYDMASASYILKEVVRSKEDYHASIDSNYLKKNLSINYL